MKKFAWSIIVDFDFSLERLLYVNFQWWETYKIYRIVFGPIAIAISLGMSFGDLVDEINTSIKDLNYLRGKDEEIMKRLLYDFDDDD